MKQSPYEATFLLTDGCMWELTKILGNEHPHSIEVVDIATGAVRYIRSGSKIRFLEGEITDIRKAEENSCEPPAEVSSPVQDKLQGGKRGKKGSN